MIALSTTPTTVPQTARLTTVLVVDENPALRQTVQAMLTASAWCCHGAADSLSALCLVIEQQPAAILLDADCGPLQPWQFAVLLQEHPGHQHVRLIYTSTRDDVIERAKAAAANVDAFLPKPFTAEDLLAALAGQLATAA
jgi:DNA-binding response OmpR family regulator